MSSWKVRSLREASAIDAGLPVKRVSTQRRWPAIAFLHLAVREGNPSDRNEV